MDTRARLPKPSTRKVGDTVIMDGITFQVQLNRANRRYWKRLARPPLVTSPIATFQPTIFSPVPTIVQPPTGFIPTVPTLFQPPTGFISTLIQPPTIFSPTVPTIVPPPTGFIPTHVQRPTIFIPTVPTFVQPPTIFIPTVPTFVQPPTGLIPTLVQPPTGFIPTIVQPPTGFIPTIVQPPTGFISTVPTFVQPPTGFIPTIVQPPTGLIPIVAQKINLWPSQVDHFTRIKKILQGWIAYLDTSPMGSGKTIVTLKVAQHFNIPIIVVAPLSVLKTWEITSQKYGVPVILAMTYQAMRGSSINPPKHGLLRRVDRQIEVEIKSGKNKGQMKTVKETDFFPTELLANYIKSGVLVVFDEMHNMKNPGTSQLESGHSIVNEIAEHQLNSTHTIVREIIKHGTSRVALLSATPIDKKIQTSSVVKLLGITDKKKMYYYDRKNFEYIPTGIKDLENFCRLRNPIETNKIITGRRLDNKSAINIIYDLYMNIVKPELSSSMSKPEIKAILDAKNGFYKMDAESLRLLLKAVQELKEAARFNPNTMTTNMKGGAALGGITKALVKIETAKVKTIYRLALEKLKENEGNKVLIYLMYKKNIATMSQLLSSYSPLVLTGSTKSKNRNIYMKRFQEPNSKYRVIIANPKVGGIGISLDDRTGDYPRFMFISPSYFFIDLFQATGRIHRGTTKSKATVRFVYGQGVEGELHILNALAKKTQVTMDMLYNNKGIKMPGDYEKVYQ